MIRQLAPEVIARIAAGEVIERPASVVKELVENALDAGARAIEVELIGGGIDLVRVSDDGHGIPAAEVELAFQRHATSKIRDDADLRSLATLGFRGEALPSMAAVARVTLTTRHRDEPLGTELTVEFGRPGGRRARGRAPGTSVCVADLFYELPARRKFLKSRAVEAAAASQLVAQYALAYPEVAFCLLSEGRVVLRTSGDGDRAAALAAALGPAVAREMVALVPATGRDGGQVLGAVTGFVGRQWLHRANRSGISLFVNRRLVHHRGLLGALEQAYQSLIPTGRHPVAVIEATVPPDEADFNVHPAKAEVKLLRERAVCALVFQAVQNTLATGGTVASWGDDPATAPEPQQKDRLAELRVLGQVGGTYIVAEGSAGIYLVDQHAAHERVLLEQLRAQAAREEATQLLLEPVPVELEPRQAALAAQHRAALEALGFRTEEFGPRGLLLRGIPGIAAGRDPAELLRATLDGVDEEDGPADWRERLAISLSCHAAVRAGDSLSPDEMRALLDRLGEAELCRTCSHGRPTAILLSLSQLEREFGRR